MINQGLWKPKRKKERKIYQRRTRRSCFGELLQADGSPHDWFEGRGDKCTLLHFVDDATSKITAGKFFPTETTNGYLDVLEEQIQSYGRPLSLYSDKHSIFKINREQVREGTNQTHFNKVLEELNIEHICAHSPQAKGRIERANATLQDRLVKEMRLKGISSIEEGNAFLPEFIADYNQRFGKAPKDLEDAHRPLGAEDDLEVIFAQKTIRKLSKNLTFQHKGALYQLETKSPNRIRKTHVQIIERRGKPIDVEIGGIVYKYTEWRDVAYKGPQVLDAKELEGHWRSLGKTKPKRNHPWR